jgi:Tat protein secretion system quality control protein TatD with DNase activity
VLEKLAEIQQRDATELAEITTANAKNLFGI